MAVPYKVEEGQVLVPQAWVERTYLPRCATCFSNGRLTPHPLAMKPPVRTGVCPICDTPAPEGQMERVEAVATTGVGGVLMAIGRWLTKLARKL